MKLLMSIDYLSNLVSLKISGCRRRNGVDMTFDSWSYHRHVRRKAFCYCYRRFSVCDKFFTANETDINFRGGTLAVNLIIKILEFNIEASKLGNVKSVPVPIGMVLTYAALDFNYTSWMSTDNLRVLRTEQSSNNIPGMREFAEQKDHLHHVSPLSMVSDRRRKKKIKRHSDWKDRLRGFASGGEDLTGLSAPRIFRTNTDDGMLGDVESDDEDFEGYEEEDKPIEARIKYKYDDPKPSGSIMRTHSALKRKQEEMAIALREADTKANQAFSRKGKRVEPFGTRLTMSSRGGYFQDRIVSPSMVSRCWRARKDAEEVLSQMRAMAILYIGPYRNPDFATDYHISPILTPDYLLAQFPPLMIQCGEKDPFVDDSVIFAGRVREAKSARKMKLEMSLSEQRVRSEEVKGVEEMMREKAKLTSESESDWVQLVLLADWSHGYLQMPTLLPKARAVSHERHSKTCLRLLSMAQVIDELGEWIETTFVKYRGSRENGPVPDGIIPGKVPDPGIMFVSKSSGSESPTQKIVGMPRGDSSRISGQTITEKELVRRRRLQDWHLFE